MTTLYTVGSRRRLVLKPDTPAACRLDLPISHTLFDILCACDRGMHEDLVERLGDAMATELYIWLQQAGPPTVELGPLDVTALVSEVRESLQGSRPGSQKDAHPEQEGQIQGSLAWDTRTGEVQDTQGLGTHGQRPQGDEDEREVLRG